MTIEILEYRLQSLAILRKFSKLGFYNASIVSTYIVSSKQKFALMLSFRCIANVALEEQLMSQNSKLLPSHYFWWIVFEVFENRIDVTKSALLSFI